MGQLVRFKTAPVRTHPSRHGLGRPNVVSSEAPGSAGMMRLMRHHIAYTRVLKRQL